MVAPRWTFAAPRDAASTLALAREIGCADFVAALLCARGMSGADEVRAFLFPKLKLLGDPFLLPNMQAAIERIVAAIDRRERIVLYGDYDVDGVTSLALFTRVLTAYGADVKTFLPSRMDEGYGLSADGIARCVETLNPQLLMALDCGTCSCTEIKSLRARGIDVLVFDHHECKGELPDCLALVNPKLGDDFHYLCSVGIVFKACHALLKTRPLDGFDLRDYLDLVALGTVADIVPLVRENRVIVQRGMNQIARTRWVGIGALAEAAGVRPPLRAADIGFKLGPRINAAGRLASAEAALELLLTDDAARAHELAANLDLQNRERQEVEKKICQQAEEKLTAQFEATRDAAIVLGEDGWHPGVLGIVASRISKANYRPALVIGFDESGLGKGSGRSIEGLSLVKALGCCAEFLEKFGGHEMAAGLTIRKERFVEFQQAFLRCAREQLSDEQLQPRLALNCELSLRDINLDLLSQHDLLQPFGTGNPQPMFFVRGVIPGESRVLKEKHLRVTLRQNGTTQSAIYFNGASGKLPPPPWDVAFQIERHEYQSRVSAQIEIKAIRAAEA